MAKYWKLKSAPLPEDLSAYGSVPPVVAQLLSQRGVGAEQVQQFLQPTYDQQFDPFLFVDMRKAVERVWQAIEQGEHITVYSDYDADAITANAVLQQTFRYLGVSVGSYVPDRFAEGYGLNIEAFEKIKAQGAQVVITVDCGTNSVDVAEWCAKNNIELIITDHHEITAATPESFALINPKNPADKYPDPQITGVGVAYKLAKALLSEKSKVIKSKAIQEEEYQEHWDKWLLDLVAVGTVADCHSLLGENRIFVKYGLLVLQKSKWTGLRAVLANALAGKDQATLDTHTLGFLIAPRINAAGRLEHANIALDALLAEDPVIASQAAQAVEEINVRRQDLTAKLISEAREQAVMQQHYKILVLADSNWPKGIVGIAAGRLATEFQKPVIVLEQGENECTGSARTFGTFDVVEALKATSGHLSKFGGHKEAAGLTLATSNLESFKHDLVQYAESAIAKEAASEAVLELDAELSGEALTLDFFDVLEELAPFGAGNPKPVFWIKNAAVAALRAVGKEGKHIQVGFDIQGIQVQGIAFNQPQLLQYLYTGAQVEVAAELMADSWNGVRRLKLRVVDVKLQQLLELR